MSEPVAKKEYYYVSAIDPFNTARRGLLAGPWPTHAEALAQVESVKAHAVQTTERGCWMAYGTAGSDEKLSTPLGSDPAKWAVRASGLSESIDRRGVSKHRKVWQKATAMLYRR